MLANELGEKFIVLSEFKLSDPGEAIKNFLSGFTECEEIGSKACLIALPYVYLSPVQELIKDHNITIGSQEMNNADLKSFTGSIAAKMLKLKDSHFVIVGRHKNRKLGENDDAINQKVVRALEAGITPFLCIGEDFNQFEARETKEVIAQQISTAIKNISNDELSKIFFLCEAPWLDTTLQDITEDLLIEHYGLYRNILRDCVDEGIFSALKIVYKIPENFKCKDSFIKALQPKGFFCAKPSQLLPLLNDEALCLVCDVETPDKNTFDQEALIDEAFDLDDNSSIENTKEEIAVDKESPEKEALNETFEEGATEERNRSIGNEEPLAEISHEREVEKIDIEKLNVEGDDERGSKNDLLVVDSLANSFNEEKLVESAENKIESPKNKNEENPDIANKTTHENTALVDDSSIEKVKNEASFESTVYLESEKVASEELQEGFDGDKEVLKDHLPSTQEENLMTKVLIKEEVEEKFQEFGKLDKKLTLLYEQLNQKVNEHSELKKEIVERNHKVQEKLKQLDPVISQHINLGDVAFFKEHPDKAAEGSDVLDEILVINEMAGDVGAASHQISTMNSQAKDIRNRLESLWQFFTANRSLVKQSFPDLLPTLPQILKEKAPEFDLTLLDCSKLLGQRVHLMNLEP